MSLYSANLYINDYLVGKGLTSVSHDNRYYYYTEGTELTDALALMPNWYFVYFYYPPV